MSAQRYDFFACFTGDGCHVERQAGPDGRYVDHSDYAALEQRVRELEAEVHSAESRIAYLSGRHEL